MTTVTSTVYWLRSITPWVRPKRAEIVPKVRPVLMSSVVYVPSRVGMRNILVRGFTIVAAAQAEAASVPNRREAADSSRDAQPDVSLASDLILYADTERRDAVFDIGSAPASDAQGGARLIVFPPGPQTFVRSVPGQPASVITFAVANTGDSEVGPLKVTTAGPNAVDFIIVQNTCDVLVPLGACTVGVMFVSTMFDPCSVERASLVLEGPGPDFATASVAPLEARTQPDSFAVTPSIRDFGSIALGATGPKVILTLYYLDCSGVGPFSTAVSSDQFIVTDDTCAGSVRPAGGTCTIGVAFRPTSTGQAPTHEVASIATRWDHRPERRSGSSVDRCIAAKIFMITSGVLMRARRRSGWPHFAHWVSIEKVRRGACNSFMRRPRQLAHTAGARDLTDTCCTELRLRSKCRHRPS
jgi:hypothetical protein